MSLPFGPFRSVTIQTPVGGAPLLGLHRPVIIAYRNAGAASIARALAQAAIAVSQNLTQRIATAAEVLNS